MAIPLSVSALETEEITHHSSQHQEVHLATVHALHAVGENALSTEGKQPLMFDSGHANMCFLKSALGAESTVAKNELWVELQ